MIYFDSMVQEIPQFQSGQQVYVYRPPSWAQTAAEKLTAQVRSNMTSKTISSNRVLSSTSRTVTIAEAGVPRSVSTNGVTIAPTNAERVISDATSESYPASKILGATPNQEDEQK